MTDKPNLRSCLAYRLMCVRACVRIQRHDLTRMYGYQEQTLLQSLTRGGFFTSS